MAKRRRAFGAAESAEVWDRWQCGEGLPLIGTVLGRRHIAMIQDLRPHRGICPPVRRGSSRALSLDAREEISRGIAAGVSSRSIARSVGYTVTLVERHSRYVLLAKVPNGDSASVITALIDQAHRLPDELVKSLTWDRGNEMAQN